MTISEQKFDSRETMIATLYRAFLGDVEAELARQSSATLLLSGDDPASNERLLRENLLVEQAAEANFTAMKNDAATPFEGVSACNDAYAGLPAPYAVCVLGMGPDGHTASLFPGAEGLDEAISGKQHCAAIRAQRSDVTGDNLERMTMTPWSLLQSRKLLLLITGEDKWQVYRQARDGGVTAELPVSLLLHQQQAPVVVYWSP